MNKNDALNHLVSVVDLAIRKLPDFGVNEVALHGVDGVDDRC